MIIGVASVKIYVPWVHSLKEKRMVVKSIIFKVQNKFNISISEIDAQDIHQTIVLGIACVTNTTKFADSIIDGVITFIEDHTEGEILDIYREIR
ncbi:DUF503 domain-containing protein [Anaerovorax sp. IOR16]|uniref:DUF503 domain-containing protein n=1 Tax=Anaerovorax sp. IOR16 TaxID=2773458 RepID=UPI0019D19237|nr:DUF503 domain-containing protein [Anaerovorax sp. IOR16]